jgi:peptide/nickel transport system substrate-binding protein
VVIKNSEPTLEGARTLLDDHFAQSIVPREAVEKWGDLNDWHRMIGTGPFILKDFVAGSSITTVRNPDYFGRDERYPQNQLPYVDKIVYLLIPDTSTADAAMRTGKIDWLSGVDWERQRQFKKTSPDLLSVDMPQNAITLHMQVDKSPFDDIRVRKALQMSIDLKTLAATYYGGTVPATPVGSMAHQAYRADYETWPQEVKDGYAYNPDGAKKLLKEAGFPNGFKTTITTTSPYVDILSIIKSYFSAIGVDLAIDVKDPGAYNTFVSGANAVMSTPTRGAGAAWGTLPPMPALSYRVKSNPNAYPQGRINDPVMEALYVKANQSIDESERAKIIREADMYIISQQWTVNLVRTFNYEVYQPWVKGYKNVSLIERTGHIFTRLWIDQGLKRSMGR